MQPKIIIENPKARAILAQAWIDSEKLKPDPAVGKIVDRYAEDLIAQIKLRHQTNPYGAKILYNSCICASFFEEKGERTFCRLIVGDQQFDGKQKFLSGKNFEEIAAIANHIYSMTSMRINLLLDLFYKQHEPEFTSSSHVDDIYILDDDYDLDLENRRKYIHITYRFDYFAVG